MDKITVKKFDEFEINESHMKTKKDKLSFICDVIKDEKLVKELSEEDVVKIYNIIEDRLKEKGLYEEGKGLKK